MLKGFERFGSTAIAMHLALFAIPLTLAVRFRIPLVVWGENSAFEYGNAAEAHTGFTLDGTWLRTYGVTHGTTAADWVGDGAERQGSHALRLALGRGAGRGRRPCGVSRLLPAVGPAGDLPCGSRAWLPRGRGAAYRLLRLCRYRRRLHLAAPLDEVVQVRLHAAVRQPVAGNPQRPHHARGAIEILRKTGDDTPHRDIASFCRFCGIAEATFHEIAERFRNRDVWRSRMDWIIDDFLVPTGLA